MVPTGNVIRRRTALTMGIFLILFLILFSRLFVLQVVQARSLQEKAQAQWTSETIIQPMRGAILDRNGSVLAMSATAYTLSVSPRQVSDASMLSSLLSPLLDMDEGEIYKKVSDKSKGSVIIKRQLDRNTAQQIKLMMANGEKSVKDALDGAYLEEDKRRYYPNGAFASQLLGLTTIDGVGQSGLEGSLNNYLSGRTGYVVSEIDGKGRELNNSSGDYIESKDGCTVYLTIDQAIQSYAEKAAREAMEVNSAQGVRIIVMDPDTGEILAMVSKPDYDPNDPPRGDVKSLTELMRNRSIADSYEPGSTFKIITMAACIEEKLTNLSEWFYCSGSIYVEGGRVRCWGNPHGAQSLTEALENSCNPVFVELGLRLGTETFYDYLEAFGFGRKTGADIPGEGSGIVIGREYVKRVDIARIGFGQSIAVTPLQLLTAACAVVNGGNLLEPYVVKEIRDLEGNVVEKGEIKVVANPISPETSGILRSMLESVVENGGGKNAYIEGYRVGGKTGTAQVYVDGVVSSDTHIGSFIGFAPMDDPEIAVLVIVDRADMNPDYGSVTAAPFARDILRQSLVHMGIEREAGTDGMVQMNAVPDVSGETLSSASKRLKAEGFTYVLSGRGKTVKDQLPKAGVSMAKGSIVMLYMDGNTEIDENAYVSVPDVVGMSVMEANRVIASYGLTMRVNGSGIAVSQTPEASEKVFPGAEINVDFALPG
ncbi:MAG: PASTA domain-containing protein [Clostridia bacterium]|nr:PASTA domain-containing protein [Clostridia bacterium]